jgi:hypothetical protein
VKGHGWTHVERAPLGLKKPVEMLVASEMVRNMNGMVDTVTNLVEEYIRLKQKVRAKPSTLDVLGFVPPLQTR